MKLQAAFEQQFFNHIIKDGVVDKEIQTDGLSVFAKHKDYMVVKTNLQSAFSKLNCLKAIIYSISAFLLVCGIWSVISIKTSPPWLVLLHAEANLFNIDFPQKDNFLVLNIVLLLTTLTSCMIYFIVGIVIMQTQTSKTMNSVIYFK